jgi:AbiV family abortive infection protein
MMRLTPDQMAEIALAALANTRRLYDDALQLRKADRTPSAFLLAGLAADELGKHILVMSFYVTREDTDAEWRKFWRRFRFHEEKLGNALLGAWVGDLLNDEPPPSVKEFHQRRLAATYVDVGADGKVAVPSEKISDDELGAVLDKLSNELRYCETGLQGATPVTLGATLGAMRSSGRADELRGLIEESGSIGAMAYAIGVRGGLSHDDAVALASQAKSIFGPAHHDAEATTGESAS